MGLAGDWACYDWWVLPMIGFGFKGGAWWVSLVILFALVGGD